MLFCNVKTKLGHRCWVLHRLSNRSHCCSRYKPQDILSDRELPTLPTCSVIRPICFDLQLSEVHRSLMPCHVFRCGNTAVFRATIVLVDNVFTSPALACVSCPTSQSCFPSTLCFFSSCSFLVHLVSQLHRSRVLQTSRSRTGAPLPLYIAFRSLHRLKSQHAKNITQRTHNKKGRTCHNPRFKLLTRWRQFAKLTTASYRIKVPSLRASHDGNSASTDRILLLWLWKSVRLSSSSFLSGQTPSKNRARVNERPRRHVALRTTLWTSSSDGRCAE